MKVLVLGADGYTGFPLSINLCFRGHDVVGVDCLLRRELVRQIGSDSVTKIYPIEERVKAVNEYASGEFRFIHGDVTDYEFLKKVIIEEDPDAIANLAQIPAAPYSMIDVYRCWHTIENNVKGTLNLLWILKDLDKTIPVVQLATMGEYKITNWEIPDGFIEVSYNGIKEKIKYPTDPISFYHLSKVYMTDATLLACKIWDNIKFTEIYQGVVYGVSLFELFDEKLLTRFDVDSVFGTAINRFTAQAVIEHPLTVYGRGGQKRGFLSIKDSIQALTLALEKPPKKENYRAVNQLAEVYRVRELAEMIRDIAVEMGLKVEIKNIPNPRVERDDDHYYNPRTDTLKSLGFKPTATVEDEVRRTLEILQKFKDRIKKELMLPNVYWRV